MSERNDVNNKNDSGQLPLIRLILADDDYFIRESLKVLLGLGSDISVTGTASNGQEALALLEAGTPADVVLMDIRMPECDGVEGTQLIKARFPEIQVLMLTTFDDDEYIIQALQNGASGYLLKNVPPSGSFKASRPYITAIC